jgi:hypothetical protein
MYIITSKTKSNRFKPHYNNATGRYYHTSKDYVNDLKAKGLEPFNPRDVKTKLKSQEAYKPSEWAKKMTAVGVEQVKQNGKTSGAFNEAVGKHLKKEVPKEIANKRKGGIYVE